ncbi:uncharacterized protein A4U43_C04F5290 [Asparagus officinalis]|uniref:DNA2/NAM7 helicase-like C-terminal domain-containing protein n=1 Tax=Asparagus officinalis TaxID=4686 RepID=A0A5P1EYE5_ASPOF|nr:uncharacterized protein A4U43_C04F5290 [Asparagus officinalis]
MLFSQVKPIPKTFTSLEQYLGSYTYPLIEEARADLSSVLEGFSRAPFIEIKAIEKLMPKKQLLYSMEVANRENLLGYGRILLTSCRLSVTPDDEIHGLDLNEFNLNDSQKNLVLDCLSVWQRKKNSLLDFHSIWPRQKRPPLSLSGGLLELLSGVRHAIFIGDEHQLPALVKSQVSENAAFGRNLFERLSSLGHEKHLLNVQYRMHPSISKFPNSNFYDKKISDGPNVMCDSYEQKYLAGSMYGSYSFKNIQSGKESRDSNGRSLKNMIEVSSYG